MQGYLRKPLSYRPFSEEKSIFPSKKSCYFYGLVMVQDLEEDEDSVSLAEHQTRHLLCPSFPGRQGTLEESTGATERAMSSRSVKLKRPLTKACKAVGAKRLTHQDLRHLFATQCIESGVDIPTVSRRSQARG